MKKLERVLDVVYLTLLVTAILFASVQLAMGNVINPTLF